MYIYTSSSVYIYICRVGEWTSIRPIILSCLFSLRLNQRMVSLCLVSSCLWVEPTSGPTFWPRTLVFSPLTTWYRTRIFFFLTYLSQCCRTSVWWSWLFVSFNLCLTEVYGCFNFPTEPRSVLLQANDEGVQVWAVVSDDLCGGRSKPQYWHKWHQDCIQVLSYSTVTLIS